MDESPIGWKAMLAFGLCRPRRTVDAVCRLTPAERVELARIVLDLEVAAMVREEAARSLREASDAE